MATETAYREALLDHYRHPRNKADTGDAEVVARGRNPRCGDDIEIGVDFDGEILGRIRFRGRGCSICIASASMMTEAASGRNRGEARKLADVVGRWFGDDPAAAAEVPDVLRPLSPVRDMPARRRCVLLAWEALGQALSDTPSRRVEV
jgi:nitrogen fixation protein NifU and related proteins